MNLYTAAHIAAPILSEAKWFDSTKPDELELQQCLENLKLSARNYLIFNSTQRQVTCKTRGMVVIATRDQEGITYEYAIRLGYEWQNES